MSGESMALRKVIVIVGPTAGGKTGWSLRLAKKFSAQGAAPAGGQGSASGGNGIEIVSADSRQVYKKMDIGTAKEPGEWRREGLHKSFYIQDIPHHLIDFLDPGKFFTVAEFKDKAQKCINGILDRGHHPFVVGGTGLYVHALVDNLQIPAVLPNRKLRRSLEEKDNYELMRLLKNFDPRSAETVDFNNKRRIIRALEVCILSGTPFSEQQKKGEPVYEFLQIGIEVPRAELYERINKRVDDMMKLGLLKEVESLVKQKYSWKLPSMSGIGYVQFKGYFEKLYSLDQAIEFLKRDSRRYAKRQLTWFKRDERIKWCVEYEEAEKLVGEFLN